ncbi:hypothetical protein GJA_736 [Janthinobacterium agaricidamnosum NBRC 102515 = DSM 9628]|uniref:Uncharacterized protein n=1 Tax=Janthinobacterium agaricidamnosum NBRC 102515 = DSM 9628 TaxID=1349767 RepID=W0V199_9BURK|nr:hypothetical protein GJA_736 [Janthinobacterium agaricidamnosum NBRC 102515 = DSM 9628]
MAAPLQQRRDAKNGRSSRVDLLPESKSAEPSATRFFWRRDDAAPRFF